MMIERLERIRTITLTVRRLQEEYKAMRPAPPAIRMDGMPHAKGDGMAMDRLIDARDALAERIADRCEELARLQRQVRPALDILPTQLFAFCLHYYFDAMTIADTARVMDRTERCVYSYKRAMLQALGAGEEKQAG